MTPLSGLEIVKGQMPGLSREPIIEILFRACCKTANKGSVVGI
jgi:hypothetical protein